MSALAEALVAAQRRALSAMEKQFVAGKIDGDEARMVMELIGATDAVDQDRLLASLNAIRLYGATVPSEPRGNGSTDDKATDAQLALIARLVKEKGVPETHTPGLPITKAQAHEIIDSLKAGTYDAEKWAVPF